MVLLLFSINECESDVAYILCMNLMYSLNILCIRNLNWENFLFCIYLCEIYHIQSKHFTMKINVMFIMFKRYKDIFTQYISFHLFPHK